MLFSWQDKYNKFKNKKLLLSSANLRLLKSADEGGVLQDAGEKGLVLQRHLYLLLVQT